jgi:hypothetical protein
MLLADDLETAQGCYAPRAQMSGLRSCFPSEGLPWQHTSRKHGPKLVGVVHFLPLLTPDSFGVLANPATRSELTRQRREFRSPGQPQDGERWIRQHSTCRLK